MPPPPRARAALKVMKSIGFSTKEAGPILKMLLDLYENNWDLIEDNNYQVLVDRILEEQELRAADDNKKDDGEVNDSEPSRKRLRKLGEGQPSGSEPGSNRLAESLLKKPKVEPDLSPEPIVRESAANPLALQVVSTGAPQPSSSEADSGGELVESDYPQHLLPSISEHDMSLTVHRETRAAAHACRTIVAEAKDEPLSPLTYGRNKRMAGERSRDAVHLKEPKTEPGLQMQKDTSPLRFKEKEAEVPLQEPITIVYPTHHAIATENKAHQYQQTQCPSRQSEISRGLANMTEPLGAQNAHRNRKRSPSSSQLENGEASGLVSSEEPSAATIDIASSESDAVKLLFSFNPDHPNFRVPSLDAVIKMVEEKCLKSYKLLQPDFSLMSILKEMCQCASELTAKAVDDDGSGSSQEAGAAADSSSQSLVAVQQPQIALGDLRPPHDPNDITKGEERVKISFVNEVSNEKYPSSFQYIPRNVVYQNAYVIFSLARIGDEDCCSDCFGDCVSAAIPCACARETGGEFAYTADGLVKETFLDECKSMNQDPDKHHHVYCQDCPLERSKQGTMGQKCKGHLVRKFIKECWSKCGCSMQCKNRIVQRGITCNLQVFFTPEGKGWGLRTLDELPKGAFVCEYVGEVLTNMELYNRTIQSTGNAKHSYPVLLDADWGSEGVLKDEEALCLDATFYGNVARFINHRCVDANLVEIPVEVETPDHHYYHLAFFTTRKIDRYEELTWDYGIDFDDVSHPVKAFKCRCGSTFCKDVKRSRSRSKALVLR